MSLKTEDYVARISVASALQLLIINYELLIAFIKDAIKSDDQASYQRQIKKAQDALGQLIAALNMEYALSAQLFDLYTYVNKLLNAAFYSRDRQAGAGSLTEAVGIMEALLSSWVALGQDAPDTAPIMKNAQQIYAGLTYKNGVLDEYIEYDNSRGFKA